MIFLSVCGTALVFALYVWGVIYAIVKVHDILWRNKWGEEVAIALVLFFFLVVPIAVILQAIERG